MKLISKPLVLLGALSLLAADLPAQDKGGKGRGPGGGAPGARPQSQGRRAMGPPPPRGGFPALKQAENRGPDVARPQRPAVTNRPSVGIDPNRRVEHRETARVNPRATVSHWDNKFSRENYDRAAQRLEQVRNRNRDWDGYVRNHYDSYARNFYPRYSRLNYRGYYGRPGWRGYYGNYHRHGFYGGYYYPVRPFLNFGTYFYYPIGYWLFNSQPAQQYYSTYYGSDVQPFSYAGVLYPTDTVRDMVVDVSGLENNAQAGFRESISLLMKMLTERLSAMTKAQVKLETGEVVINHYSNLENKALVVEGFVDSEDQNIHVPFKALLDLERAASSLLFIPSAVDPTDVDLKELDALNARIKQLGGDPMAVQEEPASEEGAVE